MIDDKVEINIKSVRGAKKKKYLTQGVRKNFTKEWHFKKKSLFILKERVCACVSWGKNRKGGERENPKQALGYSQTRGWNSRTVRS